MKLLRFSLFFIAAFCILLNSIYADKIISGYININSADATVLRYLPGVGAKSAKKIIQSRNNIPFREPNDLVTRKLISKKKYRKIQQFISVVGNSRFELKNSTSGYISRKYADDTFSPYNTYAQVYLLPDFEYIKALESKIRESRSSVIFATYVFTFSGSKSNKVLELTELLAETVKRGVSVSVVLDKSKYNKSVDNNNLVSSIKLRKRGIKVYFDLPKQTMHSKIAVIDGRWVFIGSHNMTHSALDRNREYSVMIDSTLIGYQVSEYVNSLKH